MIEAANILYLVLRLINFKFLDQCLDRYVHWVSKYMHLTQLMQADWVIST